MRTTSPPREHITLGPDGKPVKVPYNLPWWKAPLFKAMVGAVWLAICIVALMALLTLADAWVIGG